ncbi:unnamed protein product, partial [Ixodes hexagonus]
LWVILTELYVRVAAAALCIFAVFVRKTMCDTDASMEGKTVIVTGGSSGMGKETAKELVRRKARVIIGCCDLAEANRAALEIFEETRQLVVVKHLDLASFKSVRGFAKDIIATESRLDVLINNAGVLLGPGGPRLTEDGYERAFQINYLGHLLLTLLLVEMLKKSAPSRVVNVSSMLHHLGNVDRFEERARGTHPVTDPVAAYCNNKLAVSICTRALAQKLKDKGVTVNSVHPGVVKTPIAANSPRLVASFFCSLQEICGKTPFQGAQTAIYLAVHPEVSQETGRYYSDCQEGWLSYKAKSPRVAEDVFQASVRLLDLDDSIGQILDK